MCLRKGEAGGFRCYSEILVPSCAETSLNPDHRGRMQLCESEREEESASSSAAAGLTALWC